VVNELLIQYKINKLKHYTIMNCKIKGNWAKNTPPIISISQYIRQFVKNIKIVFCRREIYIIINEEGCYPESKYSDKRNRK